MDRLEATRQACERAAVSPDFEAVRARLAAARFEPADAARILQGVHGTSSGTEIPALKERLGFAPDDVWLERWLLLAGMRASLGRIPDLRIPDAAKDLLLDEFQFMADPDAKSLRAFRHRSSRFRAMVLIATLRRFPAGLFGWEESGIPRSYLLQVPWRDLPALAMVIATKIGGLAPLLVPHLNARRKTPWLLETAANRSYYLMAGAIEQQPRLRGILGVSWFRAPDTASTTPHLAWVNKVFLQNGGFVTTVGPAGEDSGVFANSPHRRALFESGAFKPMIGMALWPREAVLAWKRAHPEFAPGATSGAVSAPRRPG